MLNEESAYQCGFAAKHLAFGTASAKHPLAPLDVSRCGKDEVLYPEPDFTQ
jgi:hypothetical protein